MTRRPPVIATIAVLAAVAVMIALGVWQLQRGKWKDGLIERYAHAEALPPITWPTAALREDQLPLFRQATAVCPRPIGHRAGAGENRAGESGFAMIVDCAVPPGAPPLSVEVGWSKNPNAKINWNGGPVSGIIAPDRRSGMRLVAASAPPGLEATKPPSLDNISNNHRSYALQWFSFAAIALVIYGLALRKRMAEPSDR